jgi:hypothetical protein
MKVLTLVITITLLTACSPARKQGVNVPDGQQSLTKSWDLQNASRSGQLITLENSQSRIISKVSLKNFMLKMHVKTRAGGEGFIQFHTPKNGDDLLQGYRVIINNSDYRKGNPQKTGSLSLIRNNFVRNAVEDTWFDLEVSVKANHILVRVNNKLISDYIEPEKPHRIPGLERMVLSGGYIIIQKSNNGGSIQADQISIETLPELARETPDPLTLDATGETLAQLNQMGFPLIDFHGHLKGGLTVDQVSEHGRRFGYNYGISPNCGLNFPVTNDSTLIAYYNNLAPEPVFKAMQCEGREWITLFSPAAVSKFDYIFTDAMTWTDHKGRRMRLWIPAETFVDDEQQFMEMLVGKIEAILNNEPVDIHVNPTYLPAVIAADYDKLWTAERMDRVIKALKDNDVALEINSRFKIPSLAFIKRARAAGVKFTLGTNNADNTDLNRLEYCLTIIKEAGLTPADIFLPRPAGDKKVMKKGLPSKITG